MSFLCPAAGEGDSSDFRRDMEPQCGVHFLGGHGDVTETGMICPDLFQIIDLFSLSGLDLVESFFAVDGLVSGYQEVPL